MKFKFNHLSFLIFYSDKAERDWTRSKTAYRESSPNEHPHDMSILSRFGKHISKSQTWHICVPTSCPKDKEAGVATDTVEEGVDVSADAADEKRSGADIFSPHLCPRMGES